MPDLMDFAQEAEARTREAAIAAARTLGQRRYEPGPDWRDGVPCCRACGEAIAPRRLEALPGVGLCVGCASEEERGQRFCRSGA